ncbi:BlaI/MecI/CopY family transcriptional regulator [Candidatus Woesearchaeota archaeon]|nr:BlaI/MecI/CopY family transcriptional regulator [Candidatus Woesearchaeota archaeon]
MKGVAEVADSLSPLESRIIMALKPGKKYRAKDIYMIVRGRASKSSVSVIMDRLFRKGLVKREVETARGGIRFVYALEKDREMFERNAVEKVVDSLVDKFGSKAIVYFNEALEGRAKK